LPAHADEKRFHYVPPSWPLSMLLTSYRVFPNSTWLVSAPSLLLVHPLCQTVLFPPEHYPALSLLFKRESYTPDPVLPDQLAKPNGPRCTLAGVPRATSVAFSWARFVCIPSDMADTNFPGTPNPYPQRYLDRPPQRFTFIRAPDRRAPPLFTTCAPHS